MEGTNAEVLRNLWLTPSEPGLTDKSPPTSPLEGVSIVLFLLNIPIKSEVLPRDTLWRDIIIFVVCFVYLLVGEVLLTNVNVAATRSDVSVMIPLTSQAR